MLAIEAKQFGDEYISTEHLAARRCSNVPETPSSCWRATASPRTNECATLSKSDMRGGQRVTEPNPEAKYQSLEKYGQDLTELAERASSIR